MGNNNVYDNITIENLKKTENMKIIVIFCKSSTKTWFRNEFTACYGDQMPEGAPTSFTTL